MTNNPGVRGAVIALAQSSNLRGEFGTQAEAVKRADGSHPGLVLVEHADGLRECDTSGLCHGDWAYCRHPFSRVRGYRPQLIEHVAELFPRHIQIHYGR